MKRLKAQARLQHPVTNQILSAKDMMKFSEESMNGIKFVYTPFEAIASIRSVLVSRSTFLEQGATTSLKHQQILQLKWNIYPIMMTLTQNLTSLGRKLILVMLKPRISKSPNIFCKSVIEYTGLGVASEIDTIDFT